MKCFLFMVTVALCQGSASASVLVDNFPIVGTINGQGISLGDDTSDSFTLASAAVLTGVNIGVWVSSGDTPQTIDWSIGTSPEAGDIASGGATPVTSAFLFTNLSGFDVDMESFVLPSINLAAGT